MDVTRPRLHLLPECRLGFNHSVARSLGDCCALLAPGLGMVKCLLLLAFDVRSPSVDIQGSNAVISRLGHEEKGQNELKNKGSTHGVHRHFPVASLYNRSG